MSLVITEGFGDLSLAKKTNTLLHEFHGKLASLNGTTQVRAGAIRPELVICRDNEVSLDISDNPSLILEQGSRVRIVRVPYFGQIGTVEELPVEAQKMESGTHTRVLKARLDSGELVTVPRANVEIV